ncbi:hypothetical protein PND49_14290 [Lacticaseibacillus paracasei]|uniref:hypothetical protein n=1 Tax=Lacticaseibacillus paracasei TaxID=1597 RepID=UPI00232A9004|nr:hypothetical protein [Lacticaseibacillus paracasei]MDB7804956.1 hypothetical protein [Lacticaseibacillus paracasei]MDB7810339.1 hypothetical protein [Lacticaseibacillus paracasei]
MANTVSGYADKFVQKFGLNLQSTKSASLFLNGKSLNTIKNLGQNLKILPEVFIICQTNFPYQTVT